MSKSEKPESTDPKLSRSGKPEPTHETSAEQVRESQESEEARRAEASIRDHMVEIGRGNQQSGRQGS